MTTRPAILQCEHPSHYDRDTHEIALTARYCPGTEEGHEGAKVVVLTVDRHWHDEDGTTWGSVPELDNLQGEWKTHYSAVVPEQEEA